MRIDPVYPLTLLAACAVLLPALLPGKIQRDRINAAAEDAVQNGWSVSGTALEDFTASAGTAGLYLPDADPPRVQARANRTRAQAPGSPGFYYTLVPPIMRAYAGEEVEISVTARSAPNDGADTLSVAFFVLNAADTGWREFDLNDNYQTLQMRWRIPTDEVNRPGLLALWPDPEGQNRGVDIEALSVRIVSDNSAGD